MHRYRRKQVEASIRIIGSKGLRKQTTQSEGQRFAMNPLDAKHRISHQAGIDAQRSGPREAESPFATDGTVPWTGVETRRQGSRASRTNGPVAGRQFLPAGGAEERFVLQTLDITATQAADRRKKQVGKRSHDPAKELSGRRKRTFRSLGLSIAVRGGKGSRGHGDDLFSANAAWPQPKLAKPW
jgi:hypothetical protein